MKKIYSLLLMFILSLGFTAHADSVTFDFNNNEWELPLGSGSGESAAAGNLHGKQIEKDGITIYFDATNTATSTSQVRMWSTKAGGQLRVYKGCTMTVKAPAGKAISNIYFDYETTTSRTYMTLEANHGTMQNSSTIYWEGNAHSIVFTETSQSRINNMQISLTDSTSSTETDDVVPVPVISPESGVMKDSVVVTLTAEEGLNILYAITKNGETLNAENFYEAEHDRYFGPFTVYESCTVHALAFNNGGKDSEIVSASYVIEKTETDTIGTTPVDTTETKKGIRFVPTSFLESGKRYLIVADGLVAKPLTKAYGYLSVENVTPEADGSIVLENDDNAFTLEEVNDEELLYTIKQKDGKYLYQTGTYNSFNVSETPSDGQYWDITFNGDSAVIRNKSVDKYIQYSRTYKSLGSYIDEDINRVLPILYVEEEGEEPPYVVTAPTITPSGDTTYKDSVVVTITGDEETMIFYTTNGEEPTMQAARYEKPFTLYESATVKAAAYDVTGSASTVVSVTYTIEKSEVDTTGTTPVDTTATESGLKFVPAETVESGKRYLLVAGNVVATPLSKNYGYLAVEEVNPMQDGSLVMNDDEFAFTFTQVDNAYTIQQKNGRYLYQTGNYNSFNVAEAPNDGQYWTVAIENGTATITNTSVNKFVQFSKNYNSFGSYAVGAEDRVLPTLYVEVGGTVVPTDTTTVTPPDTTTVVPGDTVSVYSNSLAEQGDMIVENGELPEGVTYVWAFSAQYGAKASAYVKGTNYAVTTWLKTPVIDLTDANNPSLKFEQCINKFFGNVSEEATLWVCEATEATSRLKDEADWKQIDITYPEITSGNWSKYEEQVVDLSEYKGKKVQIGFRYASTADAAGTWEIKNVVVEDQGVVEGVETNVIRSAQQDVIFDLSGRRVNKAEKGLYIINGKKVLVK